MPDKHTVKRCAKCGETKTVAEFGSNKSRPDRLQHYCRPCVNANCRRSNAINRDKIRAYRRKYNASPAGKAAGKRAQSRRSTAAKAAGYALQRAIRAGAIKPANESVCLCGKAAHDLHHEDYSKPLEVVAMCRSCHQSHHQSITPEGL